MQSGSTSKALTNHKPIRQLGTKTAKRAEKSTASRKPTPQTSVNDRGENPTSDQAPAMITTQGLAELVWKHFESEIQAALLEVQDQINTSTKYFEANLSQRE